MTGLPDFNFPAFNIAATRLRAYGFEVINPAELGEAATGNKHEQQRLYAARDLSLILWAMRAENGDGLVLLPGWENSAGALMELGLARFLGLNIWTVEGILGSSAQPENA